MGSKGYFVKRGFEHLHLSHNEALSIARLFWGILREKPGFDRLKLVGLVVHKVVADHIRIQYVRVPRDARFWARKDTQTWRFPKRVLDNCEEMKVKNGKLIFTPREVETMRRAGRIAERAYDLIGEPRDMSSAVHNDLYEIESRLVGFEQEHKVPVECDNSE